MSKEMKKADAPAATIVQEPESLLDQVITETRIGRDEEQKLRSRQQIATFVEEVMKGTVRRSKDVETMISARIADIDQLLTRQLNIIMHAPEFKQLEASWRGVHYLVSQTESSQTHKVRVMNA